MRRLLVAGTLALAILVAACSDTDGASPDVTTTSSAPASSSSVDTTPTTGRETLAVQVFFLDQDAFNIGRPPYTRAVDRVVDAAEPEEGALRAMFDGPTDVEAAGGLRFVASGATGFADVRIVDGTASVRLVGGCSSGGSTFSIADQIVATLRQFNEVRAVKIFGPDGTTERPDEPGDSIPICLEP